MKTQNRRVREKRKVISFYSMGERDYIGVEGNYITKITQENLFGVSVEYSYCSGSGEFFLKLEDFKEEYNGYYFLSVSDGVARINHSKVHYNNYEDKKEVTVNWGVTKQWYHKSKWNNRLKEIGIERGENKGMKREKKLNPQNCIRAIFNVLEELKIKSEVLK